MTKDLLKNTIIAPMGTAVWLIDNTSLSFKQIGDFCDFTEAEVQLIADGIIGNGILPVDPIKNGNLTKEEIFNREQDKKPLSNMFKSLDGFNLSVRKKKKYIPMLQRRSRPDAILWLLNYYPDLSDAQIIKLIRTTKNMVQMIKNHTYEGYSDLIAKDPVILGFCSQRELDKEIAIATKKSPKASKVDENKKTTPKKIRKINVNKIKVKNSDPTEQKNEFNSGESANKQKPQKKQSNIKEKSTAKKTKRVISKISKNTAKKTTKKASLKSAKNTTVKKK